MRKKEIPSSAFVTNRLLVDWHGANRLKERYSLICVRRENDNQWSTVLNALRRADLSEVIGWTYYEEEQVTNSRWYIMLVSPANRDSYLQRILQQDPNLQTRTYADPTLCPDWQIVMLRMFVNSLRHAGTEDKIYTHYGKLLVISPSNFGVQPCEEDQLLGLTIEVTKQGYLVSHTRTFTKTHKKLKGKLAKRELYRLDADSYKLAPVLRSEPFEKGKEYYFLYNRNKEKHNIIPQFVFSDGKPLNCKIRLMQLAMDTVNTLFQDYLTVRYSRIDYAPRVSCNYFERMIETVQAELSGKTITIEDTLSTPLSEQFRQLIQAAIESGNYYNKQAAKRYKTPILTWVEPTQPADLVIRLVPPADKDEKETQKYLALFQNHTHPVAHTPYQHVQVMKYFRLGDKISNFMPRIITELAIKSMLVNHAVTPIPQLRFLYGWTVAVARHCDDQGHQIGAILQIGTQGELRFYLMGETLQNVQPTIQAMGGEYLPLSSAEIERYFDARRIGGKGPFYRFQLPGDDAMSLIEEGEFAMPNTDNIDAFFERMRTELVCTCVDADEAMHAIGVKTIPPYREQLKVDDWLTAVHLEKIAAMLRTGKKEDKYPSQFRKLLPGLRRNQIKNLSNIEIMFGALTDIHYWMEGDVCKYVSTQNTNLNSITPTTAMVRMPHVRAIHCPDKPGYLSTPAGQQLLAQFFESLTLGFGRSGDGSVYPMPFKILEEWLDQVLLSTLGKHWSAISSKKQEDKEEESTDEESADEEAIEEEATE